MKNHINSVSLTYGDTELSFYNIKLRQSRSEDPILHSHTYYELHLLSKRSVIFRLSDRILTLNPNELLIIPPQTLHYSNADVGATTVLSLSLSPISNDKNCHEIFMHALQEHALRPLHFPCTEDISLLNQDEPYRSFLGICKLKMVAAGFIYQLFAQLVENASIAVPGKQDALVLMDNMINRPDVTLAEIASTINYSQRHTARLIEKYYGTSLSQLRKDKKNE